MRIHKIYTKENAAKFFRSDPLGYAEKAHEYPCCDLPQDATCMWCEDGIYCLKIGGYTPKTGD
jgi:hypothetical protein